MPRRFFIAFCALALSTASAQAAGDPVHGAELYQICQACHSIEHDLVGPRHFCLFGRKAGSIPDFPYSDAMRRSGIVWSETTLNEFLSGPQAYVKGTRMTFTGFPDAQDRADVIAFLKEATKPK
jgi:cytochrome c